MGHNANKLRKFIVKVLDITPRNLIYFIVFTVTDIPTFLLVSLE
jgi:hypothetical protein